jgi:hypothetical protein
MAQKKTDTTQKLEDQSMPNEDVRASFVATFWDQFELSRERAQKFRENREDAYLNAVKEVIKFNKQYRNSVAKLYGQSKKTNKEMMSELMSQMKSGSDEENGKVEMEAAPNHDREELKKQVKEVAGQLERLAITPVKSMFQIIDQFEDRFEKNAESGIEYARERRHAWMQVRKEYIKLARNTHINLVERGRDSVKVLLNVK